MTLITVVRGPRRACLFEALTLGERGDEAGTGDEADGETNAELLGESEIVVDVEGLFMSMGEVVGPELAVTLGAGGDNWAGGGR